MWHLVIIYIMIILGYFPKVGLCDLHAVCGL
jgi:hypothetical protein